MFSNSYYLERFDPTTGLYIKKFRTIAIIVSHVILQKRSFSKATGGNTCNLTIALNLSDIKNGWWVREVRNLDSWHWKLHNLADNEIIER